MGVRHKKEKKMGEINQIPKGSIAASSLPDGVFMVNSCSDGKVKTAFQNTSQWRG